MSIWRYSDWIAAVPTQHRVSLGEGNTPLVRSRRIGPQIGLKNLWFKLESSNPSGSYKDRFAAAAISHMHALGQRRCLATSSGNTGSALAAYCAASQIDCRIAVVESAPETKLQQMLAYGAKLARVPGFGNDSNITARTFACLQLVAASNSAALQISAFRYSPAGMSGVQTIAYEIAEQLPDGIEHVFCQAGGGGLTLAVAHGFATLSKYGQIRRTPAIHCVQPDGNNTIAGPLRDNATRAQNVVCSSQISGLQVPGVLDGDEVIAACRDGGGTGHLVMDEEIWEMQARLAREEGIFCEPAAAVGVAGAIKASGNGGLLTDATIVCLITGSAFKDSSSVKRMVATQSCSTIEIDSLAVWLQDERQ